MKKTLAILLALVMVLTLAACGGGGKKPAETTAPKETEPAVQLPNFTFTQYGDAKITIVGAEFAKNDEEEDILRIYYEYTNTSTGDKARGHYPSTAVDFVSITQDGSDCEEYTFTPWDETCIPEDTNDNLYVQPGRTMRNTMCFRCDPSGGPVKVSCYVMVGSWMYDADSIEAFEFEIDPANLMGAPEPFELPAIADPEYTDDMESAGVYGNAEHEISINGLELTKDYDGVDVVRVKLTVTNNDAEAWSPAMICDLELYQDGIGLPYPTTWDLAEPSAEDEAYETALEPGQTVECNALYYLRNQNPVEVVIESPNTDTRLGARFDVQALLEAVAAADQAQQQAADAASAEARKALVGAWLQRDSDWEDTYFFNADGTGLLISGPEYPFTYAITGDTLTLTYDADDVEEYTFSISGDVLTMIDSWGEELLLDRTNAEAPEPVETTQPAAADPEPEPELTESQEKLAELLIGTWVNESDGETYSFNADGTGYQIYEGVTYGFSYELDGDYLQISYDDGDSDACDISISGDTLTISEYWTYTRQ